MTIPLLIAGALLAATLLAIRRAHRPARGPVRVPPAHPRRVQQALDATGDEAKAVVFAFPAPPTDETPAA